MRSWFEIDGQWDLWRCVGDDGQRSCEPLINMTPFFFVIIFFVGILFSLLFFRKKKDVIIESDKIPVGTIVRLKSGSPLMTVEGTEDGAVCCLWFSENTRYEFRAWPEALQIEKE